MLRREGNIDNNKIKSARENMKVCFISSYPPAKEGVGCYTKRLVDCLVGMGCEMSVLTFDYKIKYNDKNIYQVLGGLPKNVIGTYLALKKIKPEVIHVQYATSIYGLYSPLLWAILWKYKKESEVRIIVTFHEVSREVGVLKIFGIRCYSAMSAIADQIVVHTNNAKKMLVEKCLIDNFKIHVFPHGLFSLNKNFPAEEKTLKIIEEVDLSNKKVILFFGYIHIDKGIEYLIEAVDILYKKYPTSKLETLLLIAGDVRPRRGLFKFFEIADRLYKKKLIKLVKKFSLEENIKFLGYIKDREVAVVMQNSSMLVMPYRKVEQSGVLNFALGFNMPIVASNIGGLMELLEETGLTFEPENSEILAEKLHFVLENKKKRELDYIYKKIREKNSLRSVIDKHLIIYEKIIYQKKIFLSEHE